MLDQCASVPSSSSYKLCSRRPSKQLIAFFFFFVLFSWRFAQSVVLIQHRLRPSSLVHVDEMTIACSAALLDLYNFFLSLSFAVGKLGDLCTRQCDGCNIKGTVLPLRQPRRRRRNSAIAAAAASASPSFARCLWRGAGGDGSNCNHCAIVVGGGSAWARKLLTFSNFSCMFLNPNDFEF